MDEGSRMLPVISTEELVNKRVPTIVKEIKHLVDEGLIDNARVATMFKKMAVVHEELLKDSNVKRVFEDALEPYAESKEDLLGFKLSKRATRTWYDFSECGHAEYDALVEIEGQIKERKKEIEKALKAIPVVDTVKFGVGEPDRGSMSINIESVPVLEYQPSGETCDVKPPFKYQSVGIVFTKLKD